MGVMVILSYYGWRRKIISTLTSTGTGTPSLLPGSNVHCLGAEFVSPDGPESKLQNAIKMGGGVNHLCYSTARIDDDCDRLAKTGMRLIQKPVPAIAFSGILLGSSDATRC